jgi:hypothetical protein
VCRIDSTSLIICYGCTDGTLKVTKLTNDTITDEYMWLLDGPVSCIDFKNGNLLAGTLFHTAYFITNLEHCRRLPLDANSDCILCCLMSDIDVDGRIELLLGTYGQNLLLYNYDQDTFNLKYERKMAYPLYGLYDLGYYRDGLPDICVVSLKGMHHLTLKSTVALKRILDL